MKNNYSGDHYQNGDPIRNANSIKDWVDAGNKKEGAWCYYNNDPTLGSKFGRIYNWYAVHDSRGLAPFGWHIANDDDWKKLSHYFDKSGKFGDKLIKSGTTHLFESINSSNKDLDNFTIGFYGGFRNSQGEFFLIEKQAKMWSSSTSCIISAWLRNILEGYTPLGRVDNNKEVGFSVRCVKG